MLIVLCGLGAGCQDDGSVSTGQAPTSPTATPAPPDPATTVPVDIPDAGLRAAIEAALDKRPGDTITVGELSALDILDAGSAQIADLTGIESATGLRTLDLSDNGISDISPLAGLTGLRHLDLSNNEITDLSALAALRLGQGDSLFAAGNPLDQASRDAMLAWRARGAVVDYDLVLEDQFPDSPLVHLFEDNVLIMQVADDLTETDLGNGLPVDELAREIFFWFDDVFDYLVFVSNNTSTSDLADARSRYYGVYVSVMNDTEGIGRGIYFNRDYGSAGKLRGIVHLQYRRGVRGGPSLHEFQHAWANYTIPTAVSAHWGFSSANGQLGGFDRDDLVERGDGVYTAGRFGTIANGGNGLPYSPIELYLAGYIAADEVPDLWVAADGAWVADSGRDFRASDVRDYTIEDIVAENGRRVPASSGAQKHHRSAAVLLIDSRPVTLQQLEELSEHVSGFSHPDNDDDSRYNYYEATGGRGTMAMDGLSQFRKTSPFFTALPRSFGNVPAPLICWPDGRGGSQHQRPAEP